MVASVIAAAKFAKPLAEKAWDKIVNKIVESTDEWVTERNQNPKFEKKPVLLNLYGPDGEVIRQVEWKGPDYKPTEKETKRVPRRRRPRLKD